MDSILTILLFIISLGLLICLHELGHFSMAKLFNVYCQEFSIGFGPALIHKRKEGKETYFSLRVIPAGGYVSMYGEEDVQPEEGLNIPPSRSLEGIAKWKKAIVVSAGIIVNVFISIILIGVSAFAFPEVNPTNSALVEANSIASNAGILEGDRLSFVYPDTQESSTFTYRYTTEDKLIHAGSFNIVDSNVEMIPEYDTVAHHYVLCYVPLGTKSATSFTDGMVLFESANKEKVISNQYLYDVFKNWIGLASEPTYFPDFTIEPYFPGETEVSFNATLSFLRNKDTNPTNESFVLTFKGKNESWNSIGLSFDVYKHWLPLSERWNKTWSMFKDASLSVFEGLGVLFSGGIQNMSGIVGIFSSSKTILTAYTFDTYLYFWGMISVNLAIFNLLPFPGLDGWQLLVTAIEGISHKKLPSKFKAIMSLIGFGLLIVLMIAILVIDIMRLLPAVLLL